ncbi:MULTISPECIES: AbrB/MazE/SpoVT family DNA-binding domain-containing protein [unclassified Coleofasciculus]|uniref:AbrB/MazE/SpoVT family DNA-binding domain-containing protein n=1 Tax=unclassified Coleofasciculus TaxID=2692782 RepID=UPI0018815AF6|nr:MULTISPECIES: AbrB/MazE/SpoVT family DNA-binding domain-containing protein [unclassified Coleofasciculus]MBE9129321.1 AbrB/MazE/SpoVT family DNA-binding domain-containing protein [Coleofasciculus sp. LEGE 07081]MBE9151995.1 AbrB/MazE/SpoVT family DNA-binding domain-containing protein [Coleofasciculus sp. LEGE 07092]
MYTLKIQRIGDSLGITLPQELLQQLKVGEGDTVLVTETADGVQITAGEPEFERVMNAYRKVSQKYKNALRELAQ